MWTFYCHDDGKNPDLWARWYANDASERDRAAHDQTFDILEKQVIWKEPQVKTLSGGLCEIRISGSVKWRLLGFYYPKGIRRVFTLLMFCYHKQRRYSPPDALNMARSRMKALMANKARVHRSARPR